MNDILNVISLLLVYRYYYLDGGFNIQLYEYHLDKGAQFDNHLNVLQTKITKYLSIISRSNNDNLFKY